MDQNNNIKYTPPVPPFLRYCSAIIPTAFDDSLSYYEALCALYKYLQDNFVNVINNNAAVTEYYIKLVEDLKSYVEHYFENLDVQEEINNKLDAMAEDGSLGEIIENYLQYPQGMTLDARRFGRKLFYGNSPDNNNPVATSVAQNMQGGCVVNATQVAYMLWDSLNQSEDTNKLVLMNIETGAIENYANYTFGWCNSMTYKDGKLYVAVRGNHEGYSKDIKVINATTLALEDTITLGFNINAIYYANEKFYLLEEGTTKVHIFSDLSEAEDEYITLAADGVTYHQDIYVDTMYVYLLSSLPNNTISIYDIKDGSRIRSYNLPKYGGLYFIGEAQWLDKFGEEFILTSDILNFEECIAQFFKIDFSKNVDTNAFNGVYQYIAECDSTNDYFDADGSAEKPYTSINEALYLNAQNVGIGGNNKSYKYVYASGHANCRIINATLNEGIMVQYGNYEFKNCTINQCANNRTAGCIYTRYAKLIFETCTFTYTGLNYCVKDDGYTTYKFVLPTCTGTASFFSSDISTSIVNLNNGRNIPYMHRAYNVDYNLTPTPLDVYAADANVYPWTTTLNSDQIEEIMTNCRFMVVTCSSQSKPYQRIVFNNLKTTSGNYWLTDLTISSNATQDEKIAQCFFRLKPEGLEIRTASYQRNTGGSITQSTAPTSGQAIHIYEVGFFD